MAMVFGIAQLTIILKNMRPGRSGFPQHLNEFVTGRDMPALDAMTIQAYYTCRLAQTAEMPISVAKDGADIRIVAAAG